MPKTLLLADDSVTIQKVVGISFANEDIVLLTVDNGDDAVQRATEARPDIVLADVVMPGRNGYEVCEAIKADPSLAGTPVLLLTGTFEAFDEARAQAAGADGHITKPFEAQALVDQVNSLLAQAGPGVAAVAATEAVGASANPVSPSADTAYDFFDDEVTEPGRDSESPADTTLLGAPTPGFGPRSDEAFGFEAAEGDLERNGGAPPSAARPPEEVSAARLFEDPDPAEPLADLSPPSYSDTPSMPTDGETRILGGDEALANSADAGIDPLGSDPASERQTYGTPGGAFDLAAPSDSAAPFNAPTSDESSGEPLEARTVVTALDANDFGTPSGPIDPPGISGDRDPFAAPAPSDSFSTPNEPVGTDSFAAPAEPVPSDPFAAPAEPTSSDPFAAPAEPTSSDPFAAPAEPTSSDPFAAPAEPTSSDPFAAPAEPTSSDPFAPPAEPTSSDPFAAPAEPTSSDPFAAPADLAPSDSFSAPAEPTSSDPFAAPADLAPSDSFSAPAEPTSSDPFAAPADLAPSDSFSAPAEPTSSDPFAAPADLAPSDSFSAPAEPTSSDPFAAPADLAPSDSFSAPAEPTSSDPFAAPVDSATSDPFGASDDSFSAPAVASAEPAPVLEADDALEPSVTPFDRYDSAEDFAEPVPTLETDRQEDIGDPLDGPFSVDSTSGSAPFGASPDFEAGDPLAAAAGEPPPRSDWDGTLDDTGDGTVAFEFGGPLADVEPTEAAHAAILDPSSGRDYDVSSSDLGSPLAPPPTYQIGSPESDPDEAHDLTPPVAGPEMSPLVRQEVRDAIEKIAWEAFGQVTETLVKEALERVERIAWEVVPQMTEALIREEIRKLKGSDETGD